MAKSKERSEVEFLRAENKTLKAQVRHLKKEVARKQKREHQFNDLEERERELEEVELISEIKDTKELCPDCRSTKIQVTDLGAKKIMVCYDCGFRKLIK
jgi:hypothetical protein